MNRPSASKDGGWWYGTTSKWVHMMILAVLVPVSVAGHFPHPAAMHPADALLFLLWLAFIGGMAGYGLWRLQP